MGCPHSTNPICTLCNSLMPSHATRVATTNLCKEAGRFSHKFIHLQSKFSKQRQIHDHRCLRWSCNQTLFFAHLWGIHFHQNCGILRIKNRSFCQSTCIANFRVWRREAHNILSKLQFKYMSSHGHQCCQHTPKKNKFCRIPIFFVDPSPGSKTKIKNSAVPCAPEGRLNLRSAPPLQIHTKRSVKHWTYWRMPSDRLVLFSTLGKRTFFMTHNQYPADFVSPGRMAVVILERGCAHKWLGCMISTHTNGSHGP